MKDEFIQKAIWKKVHLVLIQKSKILFATGYKQNDTLH